MKRRAFLGAAAGVPLVLAGGAVATRTRRVRWLDLLDPRQRRQVIARRPDFDVAASLRSALESLPEDAILDARDLSGIIDLASDPFPQTARRPLALHTGDAIFRFDFNQGPIALPSHVTWRGENTRIEPARPIERILTDASPAAGMIATAIAAGLCSGREGSNRLELSSPVDAQSLMPGMPIAILGLRRMPTLVTTLASSIGPASSELTFAGDVSETIGGSQVYLRIDDELIQGDVVQGRLRIAPGGRGALGTRASAHRAGARIVPQLSLIARIESVSGVTVTLDRRLPGSVVRAPFRAGSVGSRVAGRMAIDGGFTGGPAGIFSCLASTLSNGFVVEGEVSLARASHGGFIGFGCSDAQVSLAQVSRIGRPAERLGGSIWLFGSARGNRVAAGLLSEGNGGLFIDDKSSGVSRYAVEGSCWDNSVAIGRIESHRVGGQISGSSDNRVTIDTADVSDTAFIIDEGMRQSSLAVPTAGNTVDIARLTKARSLYGDALQSNRLRGPFGIEQ